MWTAKVALLIVASALVCSQVDAGLLRVPRVYNALITTNEKLVPSRAISVSAPVLSPLALSPVGPVILGAPAALTALPEAKSTKNATESEKTPEDSKNSNKTLPLAPVLAPLPLTVYSTYHPYSYYSPFVSTYSYHHTFPFLYSPYLHFPLLPEESEDKKSSGSSSDSKEDADKDSVSVESSS